MGTVIKYTFQVSNLGNVALTNVTASDDLGNSVLFGTLLPQEIMTQTDTSGYSITIDDIKNGQIVSTATAIGHYQSMTLTAEALTTVTLGAPPSIVLISYQGTIDTPTLVQVGSPLRYTYTIQNNGGYLLSNVTIVDTLLGSYAVTDLSPLETITIQRIYLLKEADILAGSVVNSAYVEAGL